MEALLKLGLIVAAIAIVKVICISIQAYDDNRRFDMDSQQKQWAKKYRRK